MPAAVQLDELLHHVVEFVLAQRPLDPLGGVDGR